MPFNGSSGSGDVHGDVVYANYGRFSATQGRHAVGVHESSGTAAPPDIAGTEATATVLCLGSGVPGGLLPHP